MDYVTHQIIIDKNHLRITCFHIIWREKRLWTNYVKDFTQLSNHDW